MIDLLNFLNQYGTPMLLIGQILLGLVVLFLNGKFAPKKIEEDMRVYHEATLVNHNVFDKRITVLETRIKDIPQITDIHRLEKEMVEIKGDLKRIDENIDGTEGLLSRLEKQVNRMEDFLKRKEGV